MELPRGKIRKVDGCCKKNQSLKMNEPIDPYKWFKIERLEFLADGIFAIVITILILDIKVPVGEIVNISTLLDQLRPQLPKFASYVMSFVTLMLFWSNYITQFKYIEKCDRGLLLINIYLLLCVSLIPFSTAFLSEHIDFKLSIFMYCLNLVLIGSSLALQWNYVYKRSLLKQPSEEMAPINSIFLMRGKTAIPLYIIGSGLCFISNYLSILFILVVQILFALGIDQRIRIAQENK
jgi:uncharacterized membrane protein